jgi:flagellar basal body-associated protein FliL
MNMSNKTIIVTIVLALVVILAMVGSFRTSGNMNKTADEHEMSAGRPSDPAPNLIQEQQTDKSARGPATTGGPATATVPAR